jgi:hypothetical protein
LRHFKNTCRLRGRTEDRCEDDNDDEGEDHINRHSGDFLTKRVVALKNSWNEICHEEIKHGGDDGH